MSPSVALYFWREKGMSMDKVLSHTGFKRLADLHEELIYDLLAQEWAEDDMRMTPEQREHEELVEATWEEFGDYIREFVPPDEYDQEVERLLPLIKKTRQIIAAGRSKKFRESVKRRQLN
ncbi:hypothetical protein [Allorhizobium borbori]|uniref:Uncharacterized protein n=1 Tax=Allorhizobium borbori TaxID=485907 RepID=A0A7W6P2Z7_9HYPH|nr:hypothetical protein [Allorhizobium borbori]MBB4104391.1 hypothetical protein [Allorhizobium borbori]